jgi:hypothetical protein
MEHENNQIDIKKTDSEISLVDLQVANFGGVNVTKILQSKLQEANEIDFDLNDSTFSSTLLSPPSGQIKMRGTIVNSGSSLDTIITSHSLVVRYVST